MSNRSSEAHAAMDRLARSQIAEAEDALHKALNTLVEYEICGARADHRMRATAALERIARRSSIQDAVRRSVNRQ